MPRNRYVVALLVALLVVGLGIAAGAFESAPFSTGGSDVSVTTDADGGSPPSILVFFGVFLLLAVYFGLAGLAVGHLYGDITPRQARDFGIGLAILGAGALLVVDPQTAFSLWIEEVMEVDSGGPVPSSATGAGPANGSGGGGDGGAAFAVSPALVFGGLVAVLLVGMAAALRFSGGSTAVPEPVVEDAPEGDARAEVGDAAGRAARHIEEGALANGVYRAWHEMTAAVDVADPETTTPAEFADAAVVAGVDEADARALTALFREVRYGQEPVTAERERRAVETLRRIEATHAAEGTDR